MYQMTHDRSHSCACSHAYTQALTHACVLWLPAQLLPNGGSPSSMSRSSPGFPILSFPPCSLPERPSPQCPCSLQAPGGSPCQPFSSSPSEEPPNLPILHPAHSCHQLAVQQTLSLCLLNLLWLPMPLAQGTQPHPPWHSCVAGQSTAPGPHLSSNLHL